MSNASPSAVAVSTFYHFTPLAEPEALKPSLHARMKDLAVRGTITLAPEGLNATIAGTPDAIDAMIAHLRSDPAFSGLVHRISYDQDIPFLRSKVKVKKELISLGEPADPSVCVGQYVAPADWNALILREDVITIDTRNDYEFNIGHFKGALNPATRTFKEMVAFTRTQLDPKRHPHVAMYCTGGIRCEKYSAYLLTQGFEHVYHLNGGILAYLEQIPAEKSLWEGECFVFDERIAVGHGLSPSTEATMCKNCGSPLMKHDRAHPAYQAHERCGYCVNGKPKRHEHEHG